MNNIIHDIENNYKPAWEGSTEGGGLKRIYAIIGPIRDSTYGRLMDKNGIYLNDKYNYQLLVPVPVEVSNRLMDKNGIYLNDKYNNELFDSKMVLK